MQCFQMRKHPGLTFHQKKEEEKNTRQPNGQQGYETEL